MKYGIVILVMHCFLSHSFPLHQFDVLYFKQEWPGSLCNTLEGCCHPTTGKPKTSFIIHGLQPINFHGINPVTCGDVKAHHLLTGDHLAVVHDLKRDLSKKWPSLNCPRNNGISYWTRNWIRHGSCSNLEIHDYFETALALKDRLQILQILEAAGVRPTGAYYKVSRIQYVLQEATGFSPIIFCNRDRDGKFQLLRIIFCIDKSGSDLVACQVLDPRTKSNCPDDIKFPPF